MLQGNVLVDNKVSLVVSGLAITAITAIIQNSLSGSPLGALRELVAVAGILLHFIKDLLIEKDSFAHVQIV